MTTFCSCLRPMMTSTPFVSRSTQCGNCLEGLSCSQAQLYDEISAHVTHVSATSRSSVSRIPTAAAAAAAARTALLSLLLLRMLQCWLPWRRRSLPSRPHTFCRLVVVTSDVVPCRHAHQLAPAAAISLRRGQLVVAMVTARGTNDRGCLGDYQPGTDGLSPD